VRPRFTIDLAPSARSSQRTGPFAIGQLVGSTYRIERVLGVGAMGAVYEATDGSLGRHVTIKAPLLAALAQRLREEARAMALLKHPGFAQVYALEDDRGTPFLVMERILGESLAAAIEAAPHGLTIDAALDLLIGISDALAAAHRCGIVHRDLKPANVLVWGDRVVLDDFGLLLPDALGEGALADLYALGAIAYELVVGIHPFHARGLDQLAALHVDVATPAPDPRALRVDVPPLLGALIRDLLAIDPSDRPASAAAVVWYLEALRGRPHTPQRLPCLRSYSSSQPCASR
jgi:eukaryotic-like serine/threonine-protein kinase